MPALRIYEAPSKLWTLAPTFPSAIDRSGVTVADFLREQNVTWQREDPRGADVHIYKPGHGRLDPFSYVCGYLRAMSGSRRRDLVLLGEPREASPLEYRFADPANTLAAE